MSKNSQVLATARFSDLHRQLLLSLFVFMVAGLSETTPASADPSTYYIRGDSGLLAFYELFGFPDGGRVEGGHASVQVGPPAFIISPDLSPEERYRRHQSAIHYARTGQGAVDARIDCNKVISANNLSNYVRHVPQVERNGTGIIRVYSSRQEGITISDPYTGTSF